MCACALAAFPALHCNSQAPNQTRRFLFTGIAAEGLRPGPSNGGAPEWGGRAPQAACATRLAYPRSHSSGYPAAECALAQAQLQCKSGLSL